MQPDRNELERKAAECLRRIREETAETGQEIWISVTGERRLRDETERVSDAMESGVDMPLAGLFFAVKDNIDVRGFDTTAAHPDYAFRPACSAAVVDRLERAGAIVMGKTNMDQFATGLTGSRSPYGHVRSATHPDRVSGGSSSGSAVSVARGEVDFSLGTDTAGSGRVPAMFNGIYGFKPTVGRLPNEGVVPACASFDCVSVFSKDPELGSWVIGLLLGDKTTYAKAVPGRLAIPDDNAMHVVSHPFRTLFERRCDALRRSGWQLQPIPMEHFTRIGELLYGGALVAERYAAVGRFVTSHHEHCDPSVERIILQSAGQPAWRYVENRQTLSKARHETRKLLERFDGLLVPTAPRHPLMSEVAESPITVNTELGVFTTFVNLLDLAGISFPIGDTDEGSFGATLLVPGGQDARALSMLPLLDMPA